MYCTYICTYVRTDRDPHVRTYVHANTDTYVRTHVCMSALTCMYVCTHQCRWLGIVSSCWLHNENSRAGNKRTTGPDHWAGTRGSAGPCYPPRSISARRAIPSCDGHELGEDCVGCKMLFSWAATYPVIPSCL